MQQQISIYNKQTSSIMWVYYIGKDDIFWEHKHYTSFRTQQYQALSCACLAQISVWPQFPADVFVESSNSISEAKGDKEKQPEDSSTWTEFEPHTSRIWVYNITATKIWSTNGRSLKRLWSVLRHYHSICLQGLRKPTKTSVKKFPTTAFSTEKLVVYFEFNLLNSFSSGSNGIVVAHLKLLKKEKKHD